MNEHFHDFFSEEEPAKHFYQVLALHEEQGMEWETISEKIPLLPKGWFELARLPVEDRIEFTQHYWLSKLPFIAGENVYLEQRLSDFFENLEEIGIYATQDKQGSSFDVHMVYTLQNEAGFFQGFPPATEESIEMLRKQFGHINFPPDYLAFLTIHDGFSKYTDTGMIKSKDMARVYQRLRHLLSKEVLVRPDGEVIDPEHLIPFYESFGLHSYQCFYADWYPKTEMGNVFFSEHDRSISNFLESQDLSDNLAFLSFFGWLVFYLEDIWNL
jgi:hypothetical protein